MNRAAKGGIRLVFDLVEGITSTVESMHETIARHPLPFSPPPSVPTRAHGLIASLVYATIRRTTSALRTSSNLVFDLIPQNSNSSTQTNAEIRTLAALNGVCGDHLQDTGNPMAIPMSLYGYCNENGHESGNQLEISSASLAEAIPEASPNLVVLVHGLCLSEQCWHRNETISLGSRLEEELGATPLYLRYNSGRHIHSNGQEFSQLLQQLCEAWPVPVQSISLIGHSMGGLVIRSASYYADQQQSSWLTKLQRVVCLGTPHHGSMVAKAGHALDVAMLKSQYLAPLAPSRRCSAGIHDLNHGDLLEQPRPDNQKIVPLLPDVDYYFAAATIGKSIGDPLGQALGDLLVRLDSAVGSHENSLQKLHIKPENCRVIHEKNHFDLLDDERVHQQIIDWFQPCSRKIDPSGA